MQYINKNYSFTKINKILREALDILNTSVMLHEKNYIRSDNVCKTLLQSGMATTYEIHEYNKKINKLKYLIENIDTDNTIDNQKTQNKIYKKIELLSIKKPYQQIICFSSILNHNLLSLKGTIIQLYCLSIILEEEVKISERKLKVLKCYNKEYYQENSSSITDDYYDILKDDYLYHIQDIGKWYKEVISIYPDLLYLNKKYYQTIHSQKDFYTKHLIINSNINSLKDDLTNINNNIIYQERDFKTANKIINIFQTIKEIKTLIKSKNSEFNDKEARNKYFKNIINIIFRFSFNSRTTIDTKVISNLLQEYINSTNLYYKYIKICTKIMTNLRKTINITTKNKTSISFPIHCKIIWCYINYKIDTILVKKNK